MADNDLQFNSGPRVRKNNVTADVSTPASLVRSFPKGGRMKDREYEDRERAEFRRQLAAVESFSLRERQEARDEWRKAISKDPQLVAERIGWILNGSYGYGSYVASREVVDNAANARSRLNVQAYLGQVVAALEWRCSSAMARMAWNNLTEDQKEALRVAIEAELVDYEAEKSEEATA